MKTPLFLNIREESLLMTFKVWNLWLKLICTLCFTKLILLHKLFWRQTGRRSLTFNIFEFNSHNLHFCRITRGCFYGLSHPRNCCFSLLLLKFRWQQNIFYQLCAALVKILLFKLGESLPSKVWPFFSRLFSIYKLWQAISHPCNCWEEYLLLDTAIKLWDRMIGD